MFGISLESGKLIAMFVGALMIAAGSAYVTHRMDQATLEQTILGYSEAQTKAVQAAKVAQAAQDQIALNSAVAEANAQEKIVTQTVTITKEVPTYVKDTSSCITYGLMRVLDAAALGVDPADLVLPTGKSNDACAPVKASALAQSVADNYGTARANAEQLTQLQATITQMVNQANANH